MLTINAPVAQYFCALMTLFCIFCLIIPMTSPSISYIGFFFLQFLDLQFVKAINFLHTITRVGPGLNIYPITQILLNLMLKHIFFVYTRILS